MTSEVVSQDMVAIHLVLLLYEQHVHTTTTTTTIATT